MTPAQFFRVLHAARALRRKQAMTIKRAVKAAADIVAKNPDAAAPKPQRLQDPARAESALEYLSHRNKSMAGVR